MLQVAAIVLMFTLKNKLKIEFYSLLVFIFFKKDFLQPNTTNVHIKHNVKFQKPKPHSFKGVENLWTTEFFFGCCFSNISNFI